MRRSLLPLNALRVFDAAARGLSFTRAADELAVTPAAVGQQIRALEETLGVVLFRRTARGLELTPEAERALPALRAGFAAFEQSIAALQAGQVATRLSIAADRAALRYWLRPKLGPWLAEHPDVVVQVTPLDQPVDFQQANLDLALSFGPAPDAEGIFGRKIAEEEILTVAAPGASERSIGWKAEAQPELLVADVGETLEFVLDGLGVAKLPNTLVADFLAEGRLEERGPRRQTEIGYWLCAPEPQWKSPKVKALVGTLLGA